MSRMMFSRELRHLGFKRTDKDRDIITYFKTVGLRTLEVQLWPDGAHRVTHWMSAKRPDGEIVSGARHCTLPTEFKTMAEMSSAIECELTRTDQPQFPGSPYIV